MRIVFTIIFGASLFLAQGLRAASNTEKRDFSSATNLLDMKLYGLAETNFARFVEEFPESPYKSEAILHQAESRFFQTNYPGALELLQQHLPEAGVLAHEYQYLIAQTYFQSGFYRAAADAYSALCKKYPESPYRIEACYDEALAESKLENWPRVIELLQATGGNFEIAAKAQPNNGFVVDGYLLLAEAFLKQAKFAEGEKAIAQLDGRVTTPKARWRQNYLLCRIQVAAGRPQDALTTTTNLVTSAQESGDRRRFAESIFLRGEILEKLDRLPEAVEVYEQNFAEGTPASIRRQSFFKTVDLNLAQGQTTNAIHRLEDFIEKNPQDESIALARLTLGELRLKQYISLMAATNVVAAAASNLFEQAFTNFSIIITNFSQSAHVGRAYLDRGWCFWLQEKIPAAESDFLMATGRLPVSEDKAVARFKLADAQFMQTNYAAAVTNYQLLVQNYGAVRRITNSLFEPALYQTLRASLAIGNTDAAKDAMQKLLDWFPTGSFGDQSILLVGEDLTHANKESEARELFQNFLKSIPDSPRAAEIKLAIAQSFVHEKSWSNALPEFDAWVTNFASHPLLPQGEFFRALACDKAGQESNAFNLFTNFVARFPTNRLAALAQNWIADFYWNHEDYRNAEKSYQLVFQNTNGLSSALNHSARLMAGRAAFERSDYKEAAKYFSELIPLLEQETNSSARSVDEAWFALGDTYFQDFLSNTNNDISEAIKAFGRIPTNSAFGLLASGRIGDCYFQWAGLDSIKAEARYDEAMKFYGVVMNSTAADISARSQAEAGVGNICLKKVDLKPDSEKKAWMSAALQHYMNVVSKRNLRDGESFDGKWVYEAGVKAARICETSEQWEQARNIYTELSELLPPLRPALEKKIAAAQSHLETAKN